MPQIANLMGLGWKIKLQEKIRNYSFTLAREIVIGNLIKKGDELFYYLIDVNGRKALLLFLDKNQIDNNEEIVIKDYTNDKLLPSKIPSKTGGCNINSS